MLSSFLVSLDETDFDEHILPYACALARYQLTSVSSRIDTVMDSPSLDTQTMAHLAESKARIDRALEASVSLSVAGATP